MKRRANRVLNPDAVRRNAEIRERVRARFGREYVRDESEEGFADKAESMRDSHDADAFDRAGDR